MGIRLESPWSRGTNGDRAPGARAVRRATMGSMRPIDASFEGGVLRPTQPLHLRAGEHVRIIVLRAPDPSRWDLDRLGGAPHAEDAALAAAGVAEWADELDREDRR
jgi:hypothetical protein